MIYLYGMKERGASPGAQPKEGLVGIREDETAVYYNIIGYNRILSDKEERDYSLDWLGGVHEWRYK